MAKARTRFTPFLFRWEAQEPAFTLQPAKCTPR